MPKIYIHGHEDQYHQGARPIAHTGVHFPLGTYDLEVVLQVCQGILLAALIPNISFTTHQISDSVLKAKQILLRAEGSLACFPIWEESHVHFLGSD